MENKHQQEEHLLSEEPPTFENEHRELVPSTRRKHHDFYTYLPFIGGIVLATSLISNIMQLIQITHLRAQPKDCISRYTGLGHDKIIPFAMHTHYAHENRSISDPLWKNLDKNPVAIVLDQSYISAQKLEHSTVCPRNHALELYQVRAFHDLHCLGSVRQAYFDALISLPGQGQPIPTMHVNHCLDMIRQDIMCAGDDTPTPYGKREPTTTSHEPRKCRDWDALVAWTQDPVRQSCFK